MQRVPQLDLCEPEPPTGLDVHSRLTIPKRAQRIKLPGSLCNAKVSFQMIQETQDTQIDSDHFPWLCLVKMTSCFFSHVNPPLPEIISISAASESWHQKNGLKVVGQNATDAPSC